MENSLEIEIRDLFYEIMAVLQEPNNPTYKIKIGAKITQELHLQLQTHPEYHDKHVPYLTAAMARVGKRLSLELEEASITAELVASIDQFLPGHDDISETQPLQKRAAKELECVTAPRVQSDESDEDMHRGKAGNVNGPTADISFGAGPLESMQVKKHTTVARSKFAGRPITASQLRCLWACFLPQNTNKIRSRRNKVQKDPVGS